MNCAQCPDVGRLVVVTFCLVVAFCVFPACADERERSPQGHLLDARHAFVQSLAGDLEALERVYGTYRHGADPKRSLAREDFLERAERIVDTQARLAISEDLIITAQMVQQELERMAQESLRPAMLHRLFAALGDDAARLGQALVRPSIASRLWAEQRGELERTDSLWLPSSLEALVLPEISAGSLSEDSDGNCVREGWQIAGLYEGVEARNGGVAVWTGAEMIVWDGYGAGSAPWLFDPATDTWRQGNPEGAPPISSGRAAIWTGSEMIVAGGARSVQNGARYDPAEDTWQPIADGPPILNPAAVWTGSQLLLWGGSRNYCSFYDPPAWYRYTLRTEVWLYDPVEDAWTEGRSAPILGRESTAAVWTGTEMIVWGGLHSESYSLESPEVQWTLRDGAAYNPDADSWRLVAETQAPRSRHHMASGWTGEELIVWGGEEVVWDGEAAEVVSTEILGDGAFYDPATDTWVPMTSDGAPSPRKLAGAVWSGNRLLIWGGEGPDPLSDGSRYRPANDTWLAYPSSSPETSFPVEAAFWTGSQALYWSGRRAHGVRFDRTLGDWPAWTSGAEERVSRRYGAATVFTGTELLTFGGRDAFDQTGLARGDGHRFDLALALWTPMNPVDAPSPGQYSISLWTGNEMIVWRGSSAASAEGARYSPSLDAWTPMSTDGAPDGLASPYQGTWTGTELMVWNEVGGLYDPDVDGWSPVSTTGAPPRFKYGAFTLEWADGSVVAWGSVSADANEGALYDPGLDQWSPMDINSARRYRHASLFDGSEVVVWGGYGSSGYTGSIQAYSLVLDSWRTVGQTYAGADAPMVSHGEGLIMGDGFYIDGKDACTGGAKRSYLSDLFGFDTQIGARELFDDQAPFGLHSLSPSDMFWTGEDVLVWDERASVGAFYAPARLENPDADSDGFGACVDCDPFDEDVYPGAPELCDGANNDCDHPNWPSVYGTQDADDDGDGYSVCSGDCDDASGSVWALGEVTGLRVELDDSDRVIVSWDDMDSAFGSATRYDAISGPLLAGSVGFEEATCERENLFGTRWTDSDPGPDPGHARFYLTRAGHSCGEGTWGAGADGSRDPRISACS